MTPQEIKDFYGIDITTNKRDKLFIYLRAIYTKENIETMSILEIAENLKKDRTTVFYILRTYNNYINDVYFKLILECYQKKDKLLLKKSNEFLFLKVKEKNDFDALRIKVKRLSKPNIVTIRKNKIDEIKSKIKRPHILEVAANLRNKNIYLKDKIYKNWTNEDFKEYGKIIQTKNNSSGR
jgi:hypothetical protein